MERAWPKRGGHDRPASPLARWLATQVGPAPRVAATKHPALDGRALAAVARANAVPFQGSGPPRKLQLVRSYAIPPDDPSAARLANLSWTYDSAVGAFAFTDMGDGAQARQLLDQLQALQRADGSIDFAFDTANGQSIPEFRAGAIAWAGLAALNYRAHTCSRQYDELAYGAARWLLAEQVTDPGSPAHGLIRGGPDVPWISTQHNLIAREFFARLLRALDGVHSQPGPDGWPGLDSSCPREQLTVLPHHDLPAFELRIRRAVAQIDAGVNRALYVNAAPAPYLREGVGDDVRPLDTQALGILWLIGQGRISDALGVAAYADRTMLVAGRTVARSANPLSYNQTYSSGRAFAGYKPYADAGAPDVLWIEGTLEMRLAKTELGLGTANLDANLSAWQAITGDAGPLQANRAVSADVFNEYHPWPDAAAAAWELLALH